MSTAISVALYPVVFFLLFALPAYLLARWLHKRIPPGRVRDFLYKQRELVPGDIARANAQRERQRLEACLKSPRSPEEAAAAYRALQQLSRCDPR